VPEARKAVLRGVGPGACGHLSAPLAGASLGRAGGAQIGAAGGWSSAPGHHCGASSVVPEARKAVLRGVRPGACGLNG